MSDNSILIKSNPYGISVVLDKKLSFDKLKKLLIEKFKQSNNFFKGSTLALAFEGRDLSENERKELLDAITSNTDVNIVSLIDNDLEKQKVFKAQVDIHDRNFIYENAILYKGQVRSGQIVTSEKSIVVIGDVNPGGIVDAKGNVIVLGSLKGKAYAGGNGDTTCYVIAHNMQPVQIKIGDIIARSSDDMNDNKGSHVPMIAYAEDDRICIEEFNKK